MTLEAYFEKPKEEPLKLYSNFQVKMAGEDKWSCPVCRFRDIEKINKNWIRDRLFQCPNCNSILECFGRVAWIITIGGGLKKQ